MLGECELSSPYILAPLAGYTDLPFRRIARSHGASLCFTELISAEGISRRNKKTLDLMEIADDEKPVGIQIFGKDAAVMAAAARVAEELCPTLIDINFGCCAPKVTSGGSGAAVLKDLPLLYAIASSVRKAVKIPVSAKI
ncbi:MAG: tRNA-dihydrouridine synthase, partial [Spirochaetota bacterium]